MFPAAGAWPRGTEPSDLRSQERLIAQWYNEPVELAAAEAVTPAQAGQPTSGARPASGARSARSSGAAPRTSPAAQDPGQNASFPAVQEPRPSRLGQVALGAILVSIGLLLTLITYANAVSHDGGSYVIAYGPIGYGLVRLVRGLTAE